MLFTTLAERKRRRLRHRYERARWCASAVRMAERVGCVHCIRKVLPRDGWAGLVLEPPSQTAEGVVSYVVGVHSRPRAYCCVDGVYVQYVV